MMQYATERCMPPSLLPGLPANEAALRGFLLGEIASVESRIGRLYPPSSSCAAAVASDDFTVYTGTAGVALFYWAVGVGSMAGGGGVGCGRQHMPKAIEYINTVLRSCAGGGGRMRSRRVSTFMTGMAGVYAVAAAIYSSQGDRSKAAQFAGKVLEQVRALTLCAGPIKADHIPIAPSCRRS